MQSHALNYTTYMYINLRRTNRALYMYMYTQVAQCKCTCSANVNYMYIYALTWICQFQCLLGLDEVVPVIFEASELALVDGQHVSSIIRSKVTL